MINNGRVCIATLISSLVFVASASAGHKGSYHPESSFAAQVSAPEADVLQAVQEVTEDQIIHGTYSYEKERTLYGAHRVSSAAVFGPWDEAGRPFYKVADRVLAPRFFKDSGDIGNVSIRYVVQATDAEHTNVRIDAVFVDARNVNHPSLGGVESAEYRAIQDHLTAMLDEKQKTAQAAEEIKERREQPAGTISESNPAKHGDDWAVGLTIPQLEERIAELHHEVELQAKESGASLKAAPFRSATTLASLPAETEVVVVVLTPYWYGVETEDGHRGWVHRSELEPVE